MTLASELARIITVAHREPGYLRLSLPAPLCQPEWASFLEQGMAGASGVETVRVDREACQLAIRHDRAVAAGVLARALFALLERLPEPAQASGQEDIAPPATPSTVPAGLGLQPLLDRVKAMLPPPGTFPDSSLQSRVQPMIESALTEKAVFNFLNDLVVFYLIKVHWDLITKRWLKEPLAHSNAWLTTFYLVFLLVRYRKSP